MARPVRSCQNFQDWLYLDRLLISSSPRLMNILIDTNILIPLEDTGRKLDSKFAQLKRMVDQLGYRLYIHPAQFDDVNRDRNIERREFMLSRAQQYHLVPNPPELNEAERLRNGWAQTNDNGRVDNLLLHALHRGAVHLLISEDAGIRTKAAQVAIQERVYRLEQVLEALAKSAQPQQFDVPFGIKQRFLHEFDVRGSFFDSLRQGYAGFDRWYLSGAREQRQCWSIANESCTEIFALCIFKTENSPSVTDDGHALPGMTLKLCTLKVAEEVQGRKVGERLLHTAFKYAVEHHFDWLYIHSNFKHHGHLKHLCEAYGFSKVGEYNGDEVHAKPMRPGLLADPPSAIEYAIQNYPFYRNDDSISRYLIPIQPGYHETLFPDVSDWSMGLFREDNSTLRPQSNTIKKAYLCHSPITTIKPGDLVLFYRSDDRRSVEVLGVVETAVRSADIGEVMALVAKRTVYDMNELTELVGSGVLVILFRMIKYIPAISADELTKMGIKGAIQTIRTINQDAFDQIVTRSLP